MPEPTYAFFSVDGSDLALPLVVSSIGLGQDQKGITRENGHEHFHFFRCIDGKGNLTAGSRTYTVGKNMAIVLFPNEPHSYAPVQEPWVVDWITFTGHGAESFLGYLGVTHSVAFELLSPGIVAAEMTKFYALLKGSKLSQKLDLSCQLYRTLGLLYGAMPSGKHQPRGLQYARIEPAIQFIEQNFNHPLSLAQLAEAAGVSTKYFCRLFQQAMHTRPFQFINTVRVNECKRRLLEKREMSIRDIASHCGYENISYFNQVFKEITGMSPMEFRQLN